MKITTLLVIGLILMGCATSPVLSKDARLVHPLVQEYSQELPGTGKVTVIRDSGFVGSGCATTIFVDGKPVADLWPSEKTQMWLPEGEHILSAKPNCSLPTGLSSEILTLVKTGVVQYFRLSTGHPGDLSLQRTAFN